MVRPHQHSICCSPPDVAVQRDRKQSFNPTVCLQGVEVFNALTRTLNLRDQGLLVNRHVVALL